MLNNPIHHLSRPPDIQKITLPTDFRPHHVNATLISRSITNLFQVIKAPELETSTMLVFLKDFEHTILAF